MIWKRRRRPGRPHDSDTTLSVGPDMSKKTPFGTNPVGILSRAAGSHVWPQAPPLESSALGCFHEVQSEMQWTNCRSIICLRSQSRRFALNSGNRTRRVNLSPQSLEPSSQDLRDEWCPPPLLRMMPCTLSPITKVIKAWSTFRPDTLRELQKPYQDRTLDDRNGRATQTTRHLPTGCIRVGQDLRTSQKGVVRWLDLRSWLAETRAAEVAGCLRG